MNRSTLTTALLFTAILVGGTPAFAKTRHASGMTKKQAKSECRKENPGMKGKQLKACVHDKLSAAR